MNIVSDRSSNKAKKAVALTAAGVVLVAGATVSSLAAWTDTEWVWGGGSGTPGVGTSSFEVQQNVTADSTSWMDQEKSPGGKIDFGVNANSMTPSDTVYAFVRLRTEPGSDAGKLALNGAASSIEGQKLFAALTYEARIVGTSADCSATGFPGAGTSLVPAGSQLTTGDTGTFTLAKNAAEEKTVCFALTLPESAAADEALQGLGTTPVWNFTAISQ